MISAAIVGANLAFFRLFLSRLLHERRVNAAEVVVGERQSSAAAALAELGNSEPQYGPRSVCSDWFGDNFVPETSYNAFSILRQ